MTMTTTTFGKLQAGDRIVCPSTGRTEKVTFVRGTTGSGWLVTVRTTSHDHIVPPARPVDKVDR
jgi:hypothetical protein